MAFFEHPETSPEFKYAEQVYTEAFRRLGMVFKYEIHPAKRSSILANSGKVDGEPGRIGDYNLTYTNMIRVEEFVSKDTVAAYAVRPDIKIEQWSDLEGTAFRVEYFRGILIAEKRLKQLVHQEALTTATDPDQALAKLMRGRTDIYIDIHERLYHWLEQPRFKGAGIRQVCRLEDIFVYPYVHKRHAALAPKLAKVLKEMKAQGTFAAIWDQVKKNP